MGGEMLKTDWRRSLGPVDEWRRMGSTPTRRSLADEPHEYEPTRILGGLSSSLSESRRPIMAECTRNRLLSGDEGPAGAGGEGEGVGGWHSDNGG